MTKYNYNAYNKYMNRYSYIQMKRVIDMNDNIEVCNCTIIHEDIVSKVKKSIPEEETLYDLADLFKVLGDSTRIKILCALFEAEMCVCDIAALLGMTQSAISHQLRVLKQARLVKYKKEGKVVYYSLDDEHVKSIFDQGLIHISERN
ncbi:Transcriptional repressor SmtB [Clostridium neonatale]|uniref:Transcriptional repressor SmtB n=4 Tax=Clostridiaceae TaxID=31979 RepID=A0A653ALW0_9CLOT|nr:Transcriptional repressor SmtB [Clostridium neonatale]SUQ44591.1 Transcriptional repressor SmtB [Clostridium neonatale]SUQ44637.1 Transcriptional repressor SmtB [Clostridium neonatale]VCT82749.1 Transcriptional repressor SmtB [Clostridium neonatale]